VVDPLTDEERRLVLEDLHMADHDEPPFITRTFPDALVALSGHKKALALYIKDRINDSMDAGKPGLVLNFLKYRIKLCKYFIEGYEAWLRKNHLR
jgi:hypothetical protein